MASTIRVRATNNGDITEVQALIQHPMDSGFVKDSKGDLIPAHFIQITTDQVVWGGLSGATPSEAVSWGKVNPGVLPDTVVAYCDSTIAFPLFCEYAVGSPNGRRPRKELVHKRDELVAIVFDETKRNPLTVMPPFGRKRILTDKEINAIVDFLQTL